MDSPSGGGETPGLAELSSQPNLYLTNQGEEGIIRLLKLPAHRSGALEASLETYLYLALIITSIALILSVILQSNGAGLGGLTGADTGSIFTARRGVEKTLLRITIGLSLLFFGLTIASVVISG